jgi:carboxypeptidase family protein
MLCLAALCLFMGFSAMAQSENGSIIGTVLDPDGKAVVGATVTVTDVTTNASLPPAKTGEGGRYAVNDLPPGHYRVTVTMANFKTSVSDDVEVVLHRTFELPIKLEVGATNVNVEVIIGQQSMETQNTSTQQTITGRSITNLPLSSRSALLLAVLDPGAQTVGGPRNSTFEGLPKGAINITFDGINAQCNLLKSSDGFFSINDPRIDDVEEFGITTSGNDPSKSGGGAVQMAYVSKKGGNAFHGGVWEYNRNTDFDSNYYFNNAQGLPRQVLQMNDFGYKIGGPVFKDKLFFFTDFDFFQFPQSLAVSRNIYNPAAAAGNFTYIPTSTPTAAQLAATPWVTCPAGTNTCVVQLFGAGGLAALGPVAGLPTQINPIVATINNDLQTARTGPGVTIASTAPSPFQTGLSYNATTMGTRRYPDVRFDYNLTKHHSLEFDYHYSHYASTPDVLNSVEPTYPVAPFDNSAGAQISNRNLFVIAERWTIGSNMSNEIRLGIQSAPVNFGLGVNNSDFPTVATNQSPAGLPTLYALTGVSQIFLNLGNTQGRNDALGEMHETFGWTHGAHQFTFGADATQFHYTDFFQTSPSVGFGLSSVDPALGDFTPTGTAASPTLPNLNTALADLGNIEGLYASLTGRVSSYNAVVNLNQSTRQFQAGIPLLDRVGQLTLGFYAQDSWRVRPNLTFNYGLRWEFYGPPYDKNNQYDLLANPNEIWGISGPGNLFEPGSTAGIAVPEFLNDTGKTLYHNYYKAFAPSVGLAYQPNWDNSLARHIFGAAGKTVLRAGYSIAYDNEGLDAYFGVTQTNPGYQGSQVANSGSSNNVSTGTFQAGSFFLGSAPLNFVNQTPSAFGLPTAANGALNQQEASIDPHLKPPMVESWNAGIQRELSSNMVLEIRYQANHGVGLSGLFNINEVNIFENGFLNEFNNAALNLSTCTSNAAACVAAEKDTGLLAQTSTATTPVSDFANLAAAATTACGGAPGPTNPNGVTTPSCLTPITALGAQVAVPVLTAAFTGSKNGSQTVNGGTAASTPASFFTNSTFITDIKNQGAGSLATSLGTGATGFSTFLTNMVNAGFPLNYFTVNPQASGGAFAYANAYQSTFNALIVDLRHRPSHGLQFDVNYTFSKSLTNYDANSAIVNSSFTTLRNENYSKGPAPFQAAHQIKGQLVYQLPFGPGHKWSSSSGVVNRIIGGWEVDDVTRFQTGQPVLVTSGTTGGSTFNNGNAGINLVGLTASQIQSMFVTNKTALPGAVTYLPTSLLTGNNANLSVFQPCNVAGTLCGRPFFTGPSFFRTDLSVVKTTKITERVNFEMRAELLNAFNDADFYWACAVGTSPCTISTASTRFGQMGSNSTNGAYSDINTTFDPGGRIVQLVGRINF